MPPVIRDDPYAVYNFHVILTGVSDDGTAVSGAFTEVTGLELELPPIEYRGGAEDITVRKIPGLKKYTNITLKRGITGHVGFWNWVVEAMNGKARRTAGSISMLDENRQEVMRWNFTRAWPTKYTGPSFGASKNEIAMETLVLAIESLLIDT
jgi:phage tail-like protein